MIEPAFWSVYKVPLLLGVVSIILVGLAMILLVKSVQTAFPIVFSTDTNVASVAGSMTEIMVDVSGAVTSPGVYSLRAGARVEEALTAAGGIAKNADNQWIAKNINRAMRLTDGVKIYVPEVGELQTSHNIISIEKIQDGSFVSVNNANQSELESLAGVGPVTAQKIINNRPYASLDQLVDKKAIGQSLYDKIKNQLSL